MGKAGLAFGRRFGRFFEAEVVFRVGGGEDLVALEPALRLSLVLEVQRRVLLVLGWLVGGSALDVALPRRHLWTWALITGPVVAVKIPLGRRLELRITPLAATGYWNDFWGFVLEPGAGLAWRF
jgi:hypothetical protein